jgi:hypothetical protein
MRLGLPIQVQHSSQNGEEGDIPAESMCAQHAINQGTQNIDFYMLAVTFWENFDALQSLLLSSEEFVQDLAPKGERIMLKSS